MQKTPQKKRRERAIAIIMSAVAGLIVIGLLLYYVPWPQRIRIDGDAYRVDTNAGSTSSDTSYTISFNVTCLRYIYQDDQFTGHITIRSKNNGDVLVDHDIDRKAWIIQDVTSPSTNSTTSFFAGFWMEDPLYEMKMTQVSGLLSTDGSSMFIDIHGDQSNNTGIYVAPAADEQSATQLKNEFDKVFAIDSWIANR